VITDHTDGDMRIEAPPLIRVWVHPACPWAWQTALWLVDLRDQGVITLEWRIFSLEVNSSEPGLPFWEAAQRNGEAQVALALAHREGREAAFEALYVALGRLCHDGKQEMSPELVRKAAAEAGMHGLVDRAVAHPELPDEIVAEYDRARAMDVFGVPTLQLLPSGSPIYGPILPEAPRGTEALTWWAHVRFALEHAEMYELKRWPRSRRPGDTA
jgi:predicted DsbA family dithiol-disulfide isomerase